LKKTATANSTPTIGPVITTATASVMSFITMTYSISEYGMTLAPVLASLCDWGRKHMQRNGVGVTPAAD
jgi:hypothetical protein